MQYWIHALRSVDTDLDIFVCVHGTGIHVNNLHIICYFLLYTPGVNLKK